MYVAGNGGGSLEKYLKNKKNVPPPTSRFKLNACCGEMGEKIMLITDDNFLKQ